MEGRVQVCFNGMWYSVCADGWNEEESTVVCSTAESLSTVWG